MEYLSRIFKPVFSHLYKFHMVDFHLLASNILVLYCKFRLKYFNLTSYYKRNTKMKQNNKNNN